MIITKARDFKRFCEINKEKSVRIIQILTDFGLSELMNLVVYRKQDFSLRPYNPNRLIRCQPENKTIQPENKMFFNTKSIDFSVSIC